MRRPAVAGERLTQLLHLPAAAIAYELGCARPTTSTYCYASTAWPARRPGSRFTPGPEQRAVIQQFQACNLLVSVLASAVCSPPARLFDELSGRVPMPEERVAALAQLLAT